MCCYHIHSFTTFCDYCKTLNYLPQINMTALCSYINLFHNHEFNDTKLLTLGLKIPLSLS